MHFETAVRKRPCGCAEVEERQADLGKELCRVVVSGANQGGESSYAQAPENHETHYEHPRHVRKLRPSAAKSEDAAKSGDNVKSKMQD